MSKPVDDVYLTWLYRRPSYELGQAVGMLKRFQELDFTYPKQFVYINVSLDMALQKKVGWKGVWELWRFLRLWVFSDLVIVKGGIVETGCSSSPHLLFFFPSPYLGDQLPVIM